jgi:6-pyruvoyltetrahydropterin/6-carboxytetrahydropterin synthase
LCAWVEREWDHRFLYWDRDPIITALRAHLDKQHTDDRDWLIARQSFVAVPFNPTAERMAQYLLEEIGPLLLKDLPVRLAGVRIDETRKCSAEVWL